MKIFGLSITSIVVAVLLIVIGMKYGRSIPGIKSL